MNDISRASAAAADKAAMEAFKKFDSLLRLACKDSHLKGNELRAARKKYKAFLPEFQPHGQWMLDRGRTALLKIKHGLRLPPGIVMRAHGLDSPCMMRYEAGQFQLNSDASLYFSANLPGGETLNIELRMFMNKVYAFVPARIGGLIAGKEVAATSSKFMYGDNYDELADKLLCELQAFFDKHATPEDEMPRRPHQLMLPLAA